LKKQELPSGLFLKGIACERKRVEFDPCGYYTYLGWLFFSDNIGGIRGGNDDG
jgi:hypothetical protein